MKTLCASIKYNFTISTMYLPYMMKLFCLAVESCLAYSQCQNGGSQSYPIRNFRITIKSQCYYVNSSSIYIKGVSQMGEASLKYYLSHLIKEDLRGVLKIKNAKIGGQNMELVEPCYL